MNNNYIDVARRVYNTMEPFTDNTEHVIQTIAENIKANPLPTLNYLLAVIELKEQEAKEL